MRQEVVERLKEINRVLDGTVPKMLKDIEEQGDFQLNAQNTKVILDAYRTTINLLEEHYDSKIKYEYLAKQNQILTEKDIECIEANRDKSFIEIMAALKETSTHPDVLAIIDTFINGIKSDDSSQELVDRMTDAMMDICIFIRLYSKGREEELNDEINKITSSWQ